MRNPSDHYLKTINYDFALVSNSKVFLLLFLEPMESLEYVYLKEKLIANRNLKRE